MQEVELHLPPRERYVGLARQIVRAAARQAGMSAERISDLEIAVSEAATNAILAHRRHDREPAVVVAMSADGNEFRVDIRDTGPGFQPTAPDPERDWQVEGGLGVTVIRTLADRVDFLRGREKEGTCVSMGFKLDHPQLT